MNAKAETVESRYDLLKWLVVAALIVVGVVGNQFYAAEPIISTVYWRCWLLLLLLLMLVCRRQKVMRSLAW